MSQIPEWCKPGARVKKVGGWPRVNLPDGASGTIRTIDVSPEGVLRSFRVDWDDHKGWSDGVYHYGWHVLGFVVPLENSDD